MKIKKIEFENFRNFKEHREIRCATDGKVTIIYGKNGDGKTTLHQLFQWIFYGCVHFNKTTSDRLYNLEYEDGVGYGEKFNVMGRIEFVHAGESYALTRTYIYKKGLDDSIKIGEDFELIKMNEDNDWKRLERPQEVIEKLLPSGLSEYFLFDGESMIADLRVKGRDSASKLRKALYSMFDLDILENAIAHIGRTDLKTTVLGKLYISKGSNNGGGKISAIKTNIENAQNKIQELSEKIDELNKEKEKKNIDIQSISEEIGGSKTKADYERQRKEYQNQRDLALSNAQIQQGEFGNAVVEMFPMLLISKTVSDAKKKIHLKIDNNHLPEGLNKRLISYLLAQSTKECICGKPLTEESKKHINEYLTMMPPRSYTSMYRDFTRVTENWGKGYNKEKIEKYISFVLKNREVASSYDQKIHELDEEEKKNKNIEKLVIDRQKAEARVEEIDKALIDAEHTKKKFEQYLSKQMKDYDEATKALDESEKASIRLDIMNKVLADFTKRLEYESQEYSQRLEKNIQELLNKMLTSKRHVKVSEDFAVRVIDSYDDESKSEGQFAVVSFAYIGGILKMLSSEEHLSCKEYPLVLDGPFSKLDPDQRENVVNNLPDFAPQVIIFSKDSLQDVFEEDKIGSVWTITSNEEKNVAEVKEGYLWK